MGKGDKKSRRGKIIIGSYGVKRPQSTPGKSFVKAVKVVEEIVEPLPKAPEAPTPEVQIKKKVAAKHVAVKDENPEEVKKAPKKAPKKPKEEASIG